MAQRIDPDPPAQDLPGHNKLVAVILPNAVTIRDIVHTGTLARLLSNPRLQLDIYTQNPDLPELEQLAGHDRVTIRSLPEHQPRALEKVLRYIYPLLFYHDFAYLRVMMEHRPLRAAIGRAISGTRRLLGTRRTITAFGTLLREVVSRGRAPIIVGRPDLVIGTRSLVASLEFPVIAEAARRGFPLLTLASSWDNFTTKGFLPLPVERTIVWNRKMQDELTQIFEVDAGRIVVAGYPRVPLLEDTGPFTDPVSYLAHLGLEKYRRFILYSASYGELSRTDPAAPPREFQLIKRVVTDIAPNLPDDTCILVRLHPYSSPDDVRYFEGLQRVRTFLPGRADRYVERVMNSDDEHHLAAQLQFSEAILSMASTMTIDALALQRPILNIAFEPDDTGDSVVRFYRFDHFRDLLAISRAPLARSVSEVEAFVRRCLSGDQDPQIDQQAFEQFYVPPVTVSYAETVGRVAEDILVQPKR